VTTTKARFKGRARRVYSALRGYSRYGYLVKREGWGRVWRLYYVLAADPDASWVQQHGEFTRREAVLKACRLAGCPKAEMRKQLEDM
jgi:hypothetical protein